MQPPAIRWAVPLALTAAVTAAPLRADTLFTAQLAGALVSPPTVSQASGSAEFTLDATQTQVAYVIAYENLEGVESHTDIHQGRPGTNGPVLHSLPPGSPKVGLWDLAPEDAVELIAGRIYVVVHTDPYITGEIRGNLAQVPVGTDMTTWGAVKALFR